MAHLTRPAEISGVSAGSLSQYGEKSILWEHLVNAFNFDQGEFTMSYHEKLTAEHFELTPSSKMRNHLAEDVLDKNMLSLMKVFLCQIYQYAAFQLIT